MIIGICLYCKLSFRKRTQKYKFCSVTCANRHNLNGLRKVSLPVKSKDLAEFIGICLGDGYTTRYQVGIVLNSLVDSEYSEYVLSLLRALFPDANISFFKRSKENAIVLQVNSSIVANFVHGMGIVSNAKYVPKWILENQDYQRARIRGLFDTEGSISFKKYTSRNGIKLYKQLNFRNYNVELMRFVRDGLLDLGLKPTMTLNKSLYLSNDKSFFIFRDKIGFSNPKLLKRSLVMNIDQYKKLF